MKLIIITIIIINNIITTTNSSKHLLLYAPVEQGSARLGSAKAPYVPVIT